MKKIIGILFYFIMLLFSACEDPEDITGDSSLKIINDCDYSVKIYFDNTYIGRVSSEDTETWSVPSGTHTIKATCSFADNFEDSFNFTTGETTTVRLELENKYGYETLSVAV